MRNKPHYFERAGEMNKLVGACIDGIDGLSYAIGFLEAIQTQLNSDTKKEILMVMETLGSYTVDIKKAIMEDGEEK